uniref:Uncharacterized protein n=1 Tax=Plectus sambesii TaxID=2011161 RepID=A0A914V650_9BILA
MEYAGNSGVDAGTEAGSIAESLARIAQQCPEEVRGRLLSLMDAENCAQLVVHINCRLQAFFDAKKLTKNDDRSIFEKRRSGLEVGSAVAQSDTNANSSRWPNSNSLRWQSFLPTPDSPSGFSDDEQDVFSSDEEKDGDSIAFSNDRERSFSTTDSESKPFKQRVQPTHSDDQDSSMSDCNESNQTQEAVGSDRRYERLQEAQSFAGNKIDVDDDEQFSMDEMKSDSCDTDVSEDLKCLRLSHLSGFVDKDGDDSEDGGRRNECETALSEADAILNGQCEFSSS